MKRDRRLGTIGPDSPFARYFETLAATGRKFCLSDAGELDGYESIA